MNNKIICRIIFMFILLININAQINKLKIVGAYNCGISKIKNIKTIAIIVKGDLRLIGDPDDITFIDAETGKSTGYAIDDFSFLSPDGKETWINLPDNFDRTMINAVLITGVPKNVKKIKLSYDNNDISDTALITGDYPVLPPVSKRIKHK